MILKGNRASGIGHRELGIYPRLHIPNDDGDDDD